MRKKLCSDWNFVIRTLDMTLNERHWTFLLTVQPGSSASELPIRVKFSTGHIDTVWIHPPAETQFI